jgi:hypothetical protein
MISKLPAKTPEAAPHSSEEQKFNPFQPEMPQIPGVSDGSHHAKHGLDLPDSRPPSQIVGIAIVVLLIAAASFWWFKIKSRAATTTSTDAEVTEQLEPTVPPPNPIVPAHNGPSVAATVDELSKPWAAKKFNFVKPITRENIDAMVVRLPGGELWGFSLQAPFGRCELEFVTNIATLASKYRFNASHPMVVNPCDSTVYDPLKLGSLGGNTWVRGQIVQGSSLRPPISIDVKVHGSSIVAENIE